LLRSQWGRTPVILVMNYPYADAVVQREYLQGLAASLLLN
jgi:hypothetical protein